MTTGEQGPQGQQGIPGQQGLQGVRGPEGLSGDESLGEKVDRVGVQLDEVRASYDRESVKRDERIRVTRIAVVVALIAAVVGIVVGTGGVISQHNTNATTAKARVSSCLQYNRQQVQQAKAERDEMRALVDFASPPERNAAAQLRILKLYAKYDATVAKSHPPRDCTPAGITKYLSKSATP